MAMSERYGRDRCGGSAIVECGRTRFDPSVGESASLCQVPLTVFRFQPSKARCTAGPARHRRFHMKPAHRRYAAAEVEAALRGRPRLRGFAGGGSPGTTREPSKNASRSA
jgi:hypothetical protein